MDTPSTTMTPAGRGTRRALFRALALVVGIACLAPASLWIFRAWEARREFLKEYHRILEVMPADLSLTGSYRVPVSVSYPAGHGIVIAVDAPGLEPERLREAVEGLKGTAFLSRKPWEGEPISFALADPAYPSDLDACVLARLQGSPPGDYEITLVVEHPAALEGVSHQVIIRNSVCGCELMGVYALLLAAAPLALIGVAGVAFGFWPRPSTPPPSRRASPLQRE